MIQYFDDSLFNVITTKLWFYRISKGPHGLNGSLSIYKNLEESLRILRSLQELSRSPKNLLVPKDLQDLQRSHTFPRISKCLNKFHSKLVQRGFCSIKLAKKMSMLMKRWFVSLRLI